jgi:sulfur relay (sulfurtransferase) DsrF/TusC family protein
VVHNESADRTADIEIEGFHTRHLIDIQVRRWQDINSLLSWLDLQMAYVVNLRLRQGSDQLVEVSLAVESIGALTLREYLRASDTFLLWRLEHMFLRGAH